MKTQRLVDFLKMFLKMTKQEQIKIIRGFEQAVKEERAIILKEITEII